MNRLAFYTIGFLHEPPGHPAVQEFVDRVPGTHQAAALSLGFIDSVAVSGDWGPVVIPLFVPDGLKSRFIFTYSLWQDLESVYAFAYSGRHAESLKRRREWFNEESFPGFVAWWVPNAHRPDHAEAAARIDALHNHGPQAEAFNFWSPFDPHGSPTSLNRDAVKALTERHRHGPEN